jgi:hypothetical protein
MLQPKTKAPLKPVPNNYVPTGSKPYTAQKGDSWVTIAKANGNLDPLWLIQYNFETRNADEVNWYLAHSKGCKKTTADGRNFVFSGGEVVHVPLTGQPLSNNDVTPYGYGIKLGGDDDFKQWVKPVLGQITASQSGRALLTAIKRTQKTVTIAPFEGADCNAYAAPADWPAATVPGGLILDKKEHPIPEYSLGNWIRRTLDLPQTPLEGTGNGSDVVVRFTPSMWISGNGGPCAAAHRKPGTTPSQVLFHELAHAYRQASGKMDRRKMIGANASYDDKEEFFAVVLGRGDDLTI